MLVMTLFGIAVLFVEENAQFLAAVQIIVYAGAIVVLFLFVIMLLGVDRREQIFAGGLVGQRVVAVILGVLVLVEVILLAHHRWVTGAHSVAGSLSSSSSNVAQLGRSIFTTYLLPFEVTSALLVVAVIGAIVLSRRPRRRQGEVGIAEPVVDPDGLGLPGDAGPEGAVAGTGAPDGVRVVSPPEEVGAR
jgi:NADH-quinone oxidoreductase subunit J